MRKPMYSKICEGQRFIYYIVSDGTAIKISQKLKRNSYVKIYLKNGHATAIINRKEMRIKNLVAQHFIRGWQPGICVECKDGNPYNCNYRNLRLYTKREHGLTTAPRGRARPIIVEGVRYSSVLEASRALYVSDQTIWDYLNMKVNRSVLEGYSIESDY